jgi:hypothetical protein
LEMVWNLPISISTAAKRPGASDSSNITRKIMLKKYVFERQKSRFVKTRPLLTREISERDSGTRLSFWNMILWCFLYRTRCSHFTSEATPNIQYFTLLILCDKSRENC